MENFPRTNWSDCGESLCSIDCRVFSSWFIETICYHRSSGSLRISLKTVKVGEKFGSAEKLKKIFTFHSSHKRIFRPRANEKKKFAQKKKSQNFRFSLARFVCRGWSAGEDSDSREQLSWKFFTHLLSFYRLHPPPSFFFPFHHHLLHLDQRQHEICFAFVSNSKLRFSWIIGCVE